MAKAIGKRALTGEATGNPANCPSCHCRASRLHFPGTLPKFTGQRWWKSRRVAFPPSARILPAYLFGQGSPPSIPMEKPKITAYLKTYCGWSEGVRAIMRKYELPFEEKDIIANPAFRWEMEQRSGQSLSPCVEIDGHMLPDISGEEVEKWMLANGYLQENNA